MSTIRRQKREAKRLRRKSNRQIDWKKVKKMCAISLLAIFGFYALICSISFYVVYSHNKIRSVVSDDLASATGQVVSISTKGHRATFEFVESAIKYSGSTFKSYNGTAADKICVEYALKKPEINLYCGDRETENWLDDSVIYSSKILGIFLSIMAMYIIWQLATNDKSIMRQLTSKE
ncbi:MAG TPA: hypothetical protein PLJ60_03840 [Chryseolinea sp.]|nr:hypothetical protein [Chryseolinea sp.]